MAVMEDEVTALISRAKAGDKQAFAEIYALFYSRIYRFVYFLIYDPQLAQDLTQNTFIKTWNALPSFSLEKGTIQAFIFAIARNLVIDHQRKKKAVSLDVVGEINSKENLQDNLVNKEQKKELFKALSVLNQYEKQLIILRYFEDLSMLEIAEIVDKQEGAVRVRIHRVLKKLKDELEKQYAN